MIISSQATFSNMAVHFVGSNAQEGSLYLSEAPAQLADDMLKEVLTTYFLSPFKVPSFYHFSHETDLWLNEMYAYSMDFFQSPADFMEHSIRIAKHLHQHSAHPNIKMGELYVVHFQDVIVEDELVEAIGVFKTEHREAFLTVRAEEGQASVGTQEGISLKKMDKACLILFTEQEAGLKICLADPTNKGQDALYWRDEFLRVEPIGNQYHHTRTYIQLCRGFAEEVAATQPENGREEALELIQKSKEFFKEKETFVREEFEAEVMNTPQIVDAFRDYQEKMAAELPTLAELPEEFEISKEAVKKSAPLLKSVLKLDKNFHVYVHGKQDRLERGFDEQRKLSYYKLYFEQEH